MAKNHEISVYFLDKCDSLRVMSRTAINSKYAGFQTKDAIELESCKLA